MRSHPHSKQNPHFSRYSLQPSLKRAGISYVFLGYELGARATSPDFYLNGKVQYDRLAATSIFQEGLERIERGRTDHRIALMCAEKEPLECHRCILVSRHLYARGIDVRHILDQGPAEEHGATIERLLLQLRMSEPDMFLAKNDLIKTAYQIQGDKIAFRQSTDEMTRAVWV